MAIDGLGTLQTFTSPAAGSPFSATVPAGKAWRIWGGSLRFVASATVAQRNLSLKYKQGTTIFFMAATSANVTASQTFIVPLYEQKLYLAGAFYSTWLPIGIRAIWLPTGTVIAFDVLGIQAGDQIDRVNLLIEEANA